MTTISKLDEAWTEINAIGGVASDEFGRGINHAIGQALAIIERLGGSDPLFKRHYHVAGTTTGRPIDECAACGLDIRHGIHVRA